MSVTVLARTQLQKDTYQKTSVVINGASLVAELSPSSGTSQIFVVGTDGILNAYQEDDAWVTEDTGFQKASSSPPQYLATTTDPIKVSRLTYASSNDGNVWVLDDSVKYPQWKPVVAPLIGSSILGLRTLAVPNGDKTGVLVNAMVSSSGTKQSISYVYQNGLWSPDSSFNGNQVEIRDYQISANLGNNGVGSPWGYFVSGSFSGKDSLNLIAAQVPSEAKLSYEAELTGWGYNSKVSDGIYNSIASTGTGFFQDNYMFAVDHSTGKVMYFYATSWDGEGFPWTFGSDEIFPGKNDSLKGRTAQSVTVGFRKVPQQSYASPEVFVVDITGNMYHIAPNVDDNGVPIINVVDAGIHARVDTDGWIVPAQLASGVGYVISQIDSGGAPVFYCIKTTGEVDTFSLDGLTTEWKQVQIKLPIATGGVEEKDVYYVDIECTDSNKLPLSYGAITFTSDQYATMRVNGQDVIVDSVRQYVTALNANGKAAVSILANGKLSTPTFYINVAGMASDDVIDVTPSGQIEEGFKGMTKEQLDHATNHETGKPLIPADTDPAEVKAVADGLDTLTSKLPNLSWTRTEASNKYLHPKQNPYVARCRKRHEPSIHRLDASKMKEESYHFGTVNGKFFFHVISNEEAAALKQSNRDAVGGFTWSGLWGDIVDGAKKLYYDVKHVIVTVVKGIVNKIEAQVKMFVDGILQIWDGIVNFAQQLVDAIELVFNQIAVFFKDLFGWLAWLLNWDDIKAKQQWFKDSLTMMTQPIDNLINNVLPGLTEQKFKDAKQTIADQFAAAQGNMGTRTFGQFDTTNYNPNNPTSASRFPGNGRKSGSVPKARGTGYGDSPVDLADLPSTAYTVINKILDAVSMSVNFGVTDLAQQLADSVQKFIDKIATSDISSDIQTFVESLQNLLSSFFNRSGVDISTFSAFMDVIKAGIDILIDGVFIFVEGLIGLLQLFWKFFNNFINGAIHIPIISDIYEFFVGSPITVLGLVSLVLAIPTTIVGKLVMGEDWQWPSIESPSEVNESTGAPLYGKDKATTFYMISGWVHLVGSIFDFILDLSGRKGYLALLGLIQLGCSIVETTLTFPNWSAVTGPTGQVVAAYAGWAIGLIGVAVNTVFEMIYWAQSGLAAIAGAMGLGGSNTTHPADTEAGGWFNFAINALIAVTGIVFISFLDTSGNVTCQVLAACDTIAGNGLLLLKAAKDYKPWGLVLCLVGDGVSAASVVILRQLFYHYADDEPTSRIATSRVAIGSGKPRSSVVIEESSVIIEEVDEEEGVGAEKDAATTKNALEEGKPGWNETIAQ